jgi:site-specific recombinase XerD
MRPRGSEFGVFRKNVRGTTIFYYWVYDTNGKRCFRSTGKRDRDAAVKFCRTLQINGRLYNGTGLSFGLYTKNFFDYEQCPYIRHRLMRGYTYGRPWARRQKKLLENIIGPYFNERDVRTITLYDIDNFILSLKNKNHGNKTINHIISTLKIIFTHAEISKVIETNPCNGLKPFKIMSPEKGILTKEESEKLFDENNQKYIWPIKIHFIINYLAATTGIRLGEILALRPQDICCNTVNVSHSYNTMDGLKTTKTGKTRQIPIDKRLEDILADYCQGKQPHDFIFSSNNNIVPIDHKTVYKWYWYALEQIGITQDDRMQRNITFHSYRHGFNTMLLEAGVAPETVRLLTGHSVSMTARYSHVQLPNILDVETNEIHSHDQPQAAFYHVPSYIHTLVDKGLLLPDGKTVTKSLDDVALAMQKLEIQPTEKLLFTLFLTRNGEKYSAKACKKAVLYANAE